MVLLLEPFPYFLNELLISIILTAGPNKLFQEPRRYHSLGRAGIVKNGRAMASLHSTLGFLLFPTLVALYRPVVLNLLSQDPFILLKSIEDSRIWVVTFEFYHLRN